MPDRFPASLPNGPFQISKYVPYASNFTGDPVHRFSQMWQDHNGGNMDPLFSSPASLSAPAAKLQPDPNTANTYQGSVAMGNNMSAGDAPFLKLIADNYAIADNYHQGIMGRNRRQLHLPGSRRRRLLQ